MLGIYVKILVAVFVNYSKVKAFECPTFPKYAWFPGSRSCYLVQEQYPMTFSGAETWCEEGNGWLASLETQEDFNTVVNKMNRSINTSAYWFGLVMNCDLFSSKVTDKSCWKWRDGTEMIWTNWDDGEPNDNSGELCGKIYVSKGTHRWRNGDGEKESYPFVCEIGVKLLNDVPDTPTVPAFSSSSLPTLTTAISMAPRNGSSTMITFMEQNDSQAIIIGCVLGAVGVLAIVGVVVGVICYRRKKATKASTERSSSLYYETPGQHLTDRPDVPAQEQQGSAYENIAVVSSPPYTPLRPNSDTLNYVEVDFPNNTYNSPKPTPKHEQVQYAEVVLDKSDSKVPVARRVSDLYAKPMKRMKNALKKKEQSSEVQSGAYDNACNKGPTV